VFLLLSHLGTVAMGSLTSFLQRFSLLLLLLVATVLVLATCDDGVSPGHASLQIRITDAPSDVIASAEVCISSAYLQGGDEDDETEGRTELPLTTEPPWCYDLMTVRDGLSVHLVDLVSVEAGTYKQLRLVVDDATVTLVEGYEFSEGGREAYLKVPSGSASGIKVHLQRDLALEEGTITDLLVDFDVDANFVLPGAGQGTIINGVIFTPTLTEKGRTREDI
jgi:hypothetical protein